MLPGPSVIKEFERILAVHCQKEYVISTCNASVGILGVFWSMGLSNKEIIVTSLTWPGAIAGLLALNCKLKFCPVEPNFLTIDADEISKLITPETKAVFSADFLGYPCQLDKIKKVCENYDILLIHDAASSFGSFYKGYQSGFYADISIYSFGQKKLFNVGEGGAIVTQSEQIYEKLLYSITHPERQQLESNSINPFSLNVGMNLLAAEYGIKIFDEKLRSIYKRCSTLIEFLKNYLQIKNISDIRPNFYKILFSPDSLMQLPPDIKDYTTKLHLGIFDITENGFVSDDVKCCINEYKIFDPSILIQ